MPTGHGVVFLRSVTTVGLQYRKGPCGSCSSQTSGLTRGGGGFKQDGDKLEHVQEGKNLHPKSGQWHVLCCFFLGGGEKCCYKSWQGQRGKFKAEKVKD